MRSRRAQNQKLGVKDPEIRRSIRLARRNRQIRRHAAMLLGLLMIGVSACFLTAGTRAAASDRTEPVMYKYFTSVRVEAGESFSDVLDRCYDAASGVTEKEYRGEVCSINHIPLYAAETTAAVTLGDYLILPYYSAKYVD